MDIRVITVVRAVDRSSLIFDISEILSQYDSCETHSQFSVLECPTFLVKISHDELVGCTGRVHGEHVHATGCTRYSVQCKMLMLPVNVKSKLCLGSVTVLNCELTNHK